MKVIRIWGVLAFAIVAVLLATFWWLAAPSLVRSSIETLGSEAVGAKVEVEAVDLSLFPLALRLDNVQIADPEQPMRNLLQLEQAMLALDGEALAWRKLVVDELKVTGIKSGTPRQTSGALEGGRMVSRAMQQTVSLTVPELTEADVSAMVDEADLITLRRVEAFKKRQQTIASEWQQALDKAALQARIEKLKSEFARLSERAKKNKLNLIKDAKDWKKLRKAINAEREQLQQLKGKLASDKAALKKAWAQVKAGPKDDMQALLQGIGVPAGEGGMAEQLLRQQFAPYIEQFAATLSGNSAASSEPPEAQHQRGLGRRIEFTDRDPRPELLIKKLTIDGSEKLISVNGQGANWGFRPWKVGKPAELAVELNNTASGRGQLNLSMFWPDEHTMQTEVKGSLQGWSVTDFELLQNGAQNWILQSAKLDAVLQGKVSLDDLQLSFKLDINQPRLAQSEQFAGWQAHFAQALNSQQQLTIEINASGDPRSPQLSVKSGLDRLLKDAIGAKLKEKTAQYQAQIRQKIEGRVGDISALENYQQELSGWQQQLKGNDDLLAGLLAKIKL